MDEEETGQDDEDDHHIEDGEYDIGNDRESNGDDDA